MENKKSWKQLKFENGCKYAEIKLLENQARLLNQEIILRENMIKQLGGKVKDLLQEAQDNADIMLEYEYEALKGIA